MEGDRVKRLFRRLILAAICGGMVAPNLARAHDDPTESWKDDAAQNCPAFLEGQYACYLGCGAQTQIPYIIRTGARQYVVTRETGDTGVMRFRNRRWLIDWYRSDGSLIETMHVDWMDYDGYHGGSNAQSTCRRIAFRHSAGGDDGYWWFRKNPALRQRRHH
jgi:hypothetical protein